MRQRHRRQRAAAGGACNHRYIQLALVQPLRQGRAHIHVHRHLQCRVRRRQGFHQARQPGDCRQLADPQAAGAAQAGGTAHLLLQTVRLLQQPTRQWQ